MKRIGSLVFCLLIIMLFATVIPVIAQDEGLCPQTGGTLTIGVTSMVQFDPNVQAADYGFQVISNVNSMLFRIEGGQPVGDLAESWEVSEDGTVYTWHLRQGMMWHDGNEIFPEGQSREVVADDVVYTLMRQFNDEASAMPPDLRNVFVSAEAIDDYTVVLTLSAPDAIIYDKARGLTFTAILAKEAVDYWGEDYGLHPLGSGPFEFVSFSPDEEVVLRANEDYYIKPCLDNVIFKVVPDVPSAMIAIEAGDLDWWGATVPGSDYDRFANDSRFQLISAGCPVETRNYIMNQPPLDDIRLRQALTFMRDGDAINKALRGGTAFRGGGTAGPGVTGYVEDLYDTYFQYDQEKAKALLDDMGIVDTDGDGLREWNGENLVIPMHASQSSPNPSFVAAVVDAGAQIGLTIEPSITDSGTYSAKYNAAEFGLYLAAGWCGVGGTNSLWSRGGFAEILGYDDPEVYDLLEAAAVSLSREDREQKMQAVTRLVAEQYRAPSFGIYNLFTVKRTYVKDFQGAEWTLNLVTDDHNVWIAEDER